MKILFIACYSPFINNSAAIETLQYLNKLSEINNNEVHLLTVDFPKKSIYYDESLASMMNSDIKIHLINGGRLFNRFIPRKVDNEQAISYSNKKIKILKILRSIKNSVVIPDMYYGWGKSAGEYGKELMKKEKFEIIFSMHEPPSSHLCAYYIKKDNLDVPWITYWSDPWIKDSTRERSFIVKRIIEEKMEKKIIELADKFIFVTEANRVDYIKTYKINREKTFVITRGFDSKLFKRLEKESKPELISKSKVNFVYVGEIFSKLRNIKPFIEALEDIKNERPDIYININLLFFGNIDDADVKERLEGVEVSRINRRIPFNDAIKYMLSSDVLLLFGNMNSKQIPAKIYEYFGAKGKIFIILGDEEDPIRDIVDGNKRCVITLNNKNEIKEKIIGLLEMDKEDLLSEPDYNYEWTSIVDRLNEILVE